VWAWGIVVRVSIFLAAVFGLITAGSSFELMAAPRPTVEQRLKAVEKKTDYYQTKNLKLTTTYRRSKPGPDAVCNDDTYIEMTFDPQVANSGISYFWITANIRYRGDIRGATMQLNPDQSPVCGRSASVSTSAGTIMLQKFCSFDVDKGDKFRARFYVNVGNPCVSVLEIQTELKITNVGIVEPE
jgi:hypothetical protein